jgi:hypothetical protein
VGVNDGWKRDQVGIEEMRQLVNPLVAAFSARNRISLTYRDDFGLWRPAA